MKDFWLVQRLSDAWENNSKTGFDHYFSLEYMGSAEYEFSTPNDSLKSMRRKPLIVFHHEISSVQGKLLDEPKHVFIISHKDGLLEKIEAWEKWLENPRCKEATYFPENVTGLDWKGEPIDDYYRRTVAWWSYTDDFAWTLDPEVAGRLATAFLPKVDA